MTPHDYAPLDIEPCPFCGCDYAIAIEYMRGLKSESLQYQVRCPAYKAHGPEQNSKKEAIWSWNRDQKRNSSMM